MPLVKEAFVGEVRSGNTVVMPADVPLYNLNTNRLKDTVSNGLRRPVPGPGYVHIPAWLPQNQLDELNSEVRNADGTWTQVRKRNETFDLLCYAEAGCLRLAADRINWDAPPDWARPLADNAECLDEQTQCILFCLRIGETYSEPGGGSAAWSVTRTA